MNVRKQIRHFKSVVHSKRFGKARKVVVTVAGIIVMLVGVALIFLPGPAFIVIPAGFALLATEFEWARRWLNVARGWVRKVRTKLKIARAH